MAEGDTALASAVTVANRMDEKSNAERPAPRENLVNNAVRFLQNPKVRESTLAQQTAFLAKKGLTQHEIDLAVDRSGTANGALQAAPLPGKETNHNAVPAHAAPLVVVVSPWAQWRDRTVTMIVLGGISYAVYQILKRYMFPLWTGPSEEQQRTQANIAELATSLQSVVSSLGDIQKSLKEQQEQLRQVVLNTAAGRGPMEYDRMQQQQGVSEIKGEIQSLKALLLSRKQFPPTPKTTPIIPAWQLGNTSPTSPASPTSSMPTASLTSPVPSADDVVAAVNTSPEQIAAASTLTKGAPSVSLTNPEANPFTEQPLEATPVTKNEDKLSFDARPTKMVLRNGINQDGDTSVDSATMATTLYDAGIILEGNELEGTKEGNELEGTNI